MSDAFFFDNLDQFAENGAYLDEGGNSVSYRELLDESDRFASKLVSRCLALCIASNTPAFLTAYIGFLRKGVVPVLLPAQFEINSLIDLIKTFKPSYLLLPTFVGEIPLGYQYSQSIGSYQLFWNSIASPELNKELALLMTTSGSTGSSKLVRISYQNLQTNICSIKEYMELESTSRAITTLPFNYSYGLSIINSHLFVGGSIILNEHSIAEMQFWEKFEKLSATHLGGVPFTYEMLKRFQSKLFSIKSLKVLTQAGGRLSKELVDFFAKESATRSVKFFVMYGQTEATARMSYLRCEDALLRPTSIGKAVPGGRFSIIDQTGGVVLEPNQEGELVYEGANVSMGYATSQTDLAKGDENFQRLFTGDIATFDEFGYFYIVGRTSRIAKIYGVRINLEELDSYLYSLGVTSASVTDDSKIWVFAEGKFSETITHSQICKFLNLREGLVVVKAIECIPRTSSGKVDFRELSKWV